MNMRIGRITRHIAIAAALIGLGAASTLALQQPEGATPPAGEMPDFSKMSKKELAAMMEAMGGRSEEHDLLGFMVGKSEHDVKMTMGHGIPDMTAKALGEGEWMLGKRFVVTRTRPAPGEEMATEAMNIFGYDTRKKEYFWIGLDTMGTYFVTAFGGYDEATKTFTLFGEETHEQIGKVRHRMIITVTGDRTSTSAIEFEMQPGTNTWSRVVEIQSKSIE
jgi:hypothetical protein